MSTHQAPGLDLERLLNTGAAVARSGNQVAARALFLALSREHPDDARVWLGLAEATADQDERLGALERAVALDPANERARAAFAELATAQPPADPSVTVILPETRAEAEAPAAPAATALVVAERGTPEDDSADEKAPFPLLNLLALLLILALLGALGVIIGRNLLGAGQTTAAATATPFLAVVPDPGALPTAPPAVQTPPPATAASLPTEARSGAPPATEAAQSTAATTAQPAPTQPAAAAPTASTELPLGQLIDYDGWSATLLRPDYAVTLDGAIGDLQPAGRFVLAVVAVMNNSPNPRLIPPDLFALTDAAGRTFLPTPGASTAYLALYERGQRGDLALEDVLDAGSGVRSVPILFDVPLDATSLRLTMSGAAGAGWPVGGAAPATVGP